ncbi:MAG: hypothetical protein P4L77_12055 [Sulfuriferula sp.]|nr:hypothetical protein [Sulfuriferula sp.]
MGILEDGAKELLERQAHERQSKAPVELVLDGSNEVIFPGFPYIFEAVHEKILVSIDIFKSGYECPECKGKRQIKYECSCVRSGGPKARPGFRFNQQQLEDLTEGLGVDIAAARGEQPCPECGGNPVSVKRDETCTVCKGTGAILELPDTSKNLPTTGVVVSMGSAAVEKASFKVGDRILFGPHAGGLIPTKSGIMLKHMDWQQAYCIIKGADDMGAFDFIVQAD